MTDKDIHDAYERIKPDRNAKERMLQNILSAAPDVPPEVRRKKSGWKWGLLLAAAAAAGLSVMAAAYGTDFFGMWSVGMRNREIYSPAGTEEPVCEPSTKVVDMVSMQGLHDSPEYQACMEWQDFLLDYDTDGEILKQEDKNPKFWYGPYEAYICYSQDMANELDRLCGKYSLSLLGPAADIFPHESFCGVEIGKLCGGPVKNGVNTFYWGYYYSGGSFLFEGALEYMDGSTIDYQFSRAVKGYLSTLVLNVGSLDDYEQWEYTTKNGVPLLLALGPSKGLVIADMQDSFVMVNVLGNWTAGEFTLERQEMEDFAEAFDLSVIS